MRIVIDIPGNVSQGLESPERGESRWAQNWAKFLAGEGHEVICICAYGWTWGETKPIPNVTLIPFNSNQHIACDIFMHAAWWPGRDIGKIEAKTYVHLAYGFEPHLKDPNFITKNHVIAYPYELGARSFMSSGNPFLNKTFCLPVPLCEKFGSSHFHKDFITYSAKDVFLDRYYPNRVWYEKGRDTILAMKKIASELSLGCNFMIADQLLDRSSQCVQEYDIVNLVASIPVQNTFSLMRLGKVYEVLENTKVVLPVISPGGSMIEAVMKGIVPLTYRGSLFDDAAAEHDFLLDQTSSAEKIEDSLRRICTDQNLYNELLSKYQTALKGHLYEYSRRYFNKLKNFREI